MADGVDKTVDDLLNRASKPKSQQDARLEEALRTKEILDKSRDATILAANGQMDNARAVIETAKQDTQALGDGNLKQAIGAKVRMDEGRINRTERLSSVYQTPGTPSKSVAPTAESHVIKTFKTQLEHVGANLKIAQQQLREYQRFGKPEEIEAKLNGAGTHDEQIRKMREENDDRFRAVRDEKDKYRRQCDDLQTRLNSKSSAASTPHIDVMEGILTSANSERLAELRKQNLPQEAYATALNTAVLQEIGNMQELLGDIADPWISMVESTADLSTRASEAETKYNGQKQAVAELLYNFAVALGVPQDDIAANRARDQRAYIHAVTPRIVEGMKKTRAVLSTYKTNEPRIAQSLESYLAIGDAFGGLRGDELVKRIQSLRDWANKAKAANDSLVGRNKDLGYEISRLKGEASRAQNGKR